jgi:hypothetical protein
MIIVAMLFFLPLLSFGETHSDGAIPSTSLNVASSTTLYPFNFIALPRTGYVELSWDRVYTSYSLVIFRSYNLNLPGNKDGSYYNISEVLYSQTRYVDYDVEPGGRYVYYLSGFDYLSDFRMVELGAGIPAPSRELRAEISSQRINLTWWVPYKEGGTGVKEFSIYKKVDSGSYRLLSTLDRAEGMVVNEIDTSWFNTNLFEYDDMDISPGHVYSYRITAVNEVGEGWAGIGALTPKASPTITLIKPIVESCDVDVVQVNWTLEPSGGEVESFRVYFYRAYWWYEDDNFATNYLESSMVKEVSYPVNSTRIEIHADSGMVIRVSAVYSDGTEAFSDMAHSDLGWCEGAYTDYNLYIVGFGALVLLVALVLAVIVLNRRSIKR